jgi:hypothetical protein
MTLTQSQAHARAKAKVGKSNQVGSCLAECINPAYNPPLPIPGPWRFEGNGKAWAYNYWLAAVEHGKVVKTSDPMKVPAGALLFHAPRPRATTNGGKAGHVAISAGDGYEFSTDQPHDGHWGKVKIAAVEQAWGKKLVGYIVVTGDGVRLMPDPVPAKPAPAPKPTIEPELWFGIDFRNLAGFNDEGARTFDKRMPALVADIAEVGRPVVAVVELLQAHEGDRIQARRGRPRSPHLRPRRHADCRTQGLRPQAPPPEGRQAGRGRPDHPEHHPGADRHGPA